MKIRDEIDEIRQIEEQRKMRERIFEIVKKHENTSETEEDEK